MSPPRCRRKRQRVLLSSRIAGVWDQRAGRVGEKRAEADRGRRQWVSCVGFCVKRHPVCHRFNTLLGVLFQESTVIPTMLTPRRRRSSHTAVSEGGSVGVQGKVADWKRGVSSVEKDCQSWRRDAADTCRDSWSLPFFLALNSFPQWDSCVVTQFKWHSNHF